MQLATFARDFEFRESQGSGRDGWWVWHSMEIFLDWANVGENSVINFQSQVIQKMRSRQAFVLEILRFIKWNMMTILDNARRQI